MNIQNDAALHDIGLLSTKDSDPFDKLTRLASMMLKAPVALVSIVMPAEDRQFFKSAVGLPEPWKSRHQTPLSHSFCKHVRASNTPLIVPDARLNPLVRNNGAVADLGVIAYAGFPIHGPDDNAIGAFCLIDGVPRDWSTEDLLVMADFAAVVDDQIRLLSAMHSRDAALAAEREAAAAKSRFFATISHEVRTPLCGILGMAEVLLDRVDDTDQRDMLGTIRASGHTLLHILNDVLDIAKAEAGKLRLERENFDLHELVSQIEMLHRAPAQAKGLTLITTLANDVPALVTGDPYRLQQILNNLMSNAVKFTHQGKVTLAVNCDAGTLHDGRLPIRFCVTDTGIGMTKEQMTRLFVPFEQAEHGTTRRYGGTGLGTSIVARLVELMEGNIRVESNHGLGSVFDVTLPIHPATISLAPPQDAPVAQQGDETLAGLRLLVADDNATNRKLLSLFLCQAGAVVDLVENGQIAIEHALLTAYDALLFDISMPVLDGLAALEQIKAAFARQGHLCPPAIAITANAAAEDVLRYRALGFDGVVTKPFARQPLLTALRKVIPTQ